MKATFTTTIVRFGKKTKTNQDALSQGILTRDINLTCLKGQNLKIEPFCPKFRPVPRMLDVFTGRMVSLMRPLTFAPAVCKKQPVIISNWRNSPRQSLKKITKL